MGRGRFILTSSIAAFGFQAERITEDTTSTALDSSINYFRTKRLAELEVLQAVERGLDAVILNPANIIGRYDASGWSRFFKLIEEGRLPGVPPGSGSFCHAREVARAHVTAFERGQAGHHYLLGGVDATFLEVVQRIGALLDRPVPKRPIPDLRFQGSRPVVALGLVPDAPGARPHSRKGRPPLGRPAVQLRQSRARACLPPRRPSG